jgi:hypothetical protein
MPTCEHWRDCGITGGGCCAAGHYGGKPSHGICERICRNGANPPSKPMPIPADFDADREVRRMKQGGCCGGNKQ